MVWTSKVLWTAAWVDRNRFANPCHLNRCIFLSRPRVGWWEFSARLFRRCHRSWRASSPSCRLAAPYDPSSSVLIVSGATPCLLTSSRMSLTAARVSRLVCTKTSSTSPSSSTARPSKCRLPAIVISISSRCHRAVRRGRPKLAREQRAELADPASNGFVAQVETTPGLHVFDIAQAQREAQVKPDTCWMTAGGNRWPW